MPAYMCNIYIRKSDQSEVICWHVCDWITTTVLPPLMKMSNSILDMTYSWFCIANTNISLLFIDTSLCLSGWQEHWKRWSFHHSYCQWNSLHFAVNCVCLSLGFETLLWKHVRWQGQFTTGIHQCWLGRVDAEMYNWRGHMEVWGQSPPVVFKKYSYLWTVVMQPKRSSNKMYKYPRYFLQWNVFVGAVKSESSCRIPWHMNCHLPGVIVLAD